MTDDEKEKKLIEYESEIKKLENRKKDLFNKLSVLNVKVKGKKKPEEVKEAENRKRSLVESKKNLLNEIRDLNKQMTVIKQQITGFDDQKPDKFKKNNVLPQDEEELDYLIGGWDEYYQTKSLKKDEDEEIMRKIIELEKLRPNLSDVNNLNREIITLKKRLTTIRSRAKEVKESLTSINVEIEDCDETINN